MINNLLDEPVWLDIDERLDPLFKRFGYNNRLHFINLGNPVKDVLDALFLQLFESRNEISFSKEELITFLQENSEELKVLLVKYCSKGLLNQDRNDDFPDEIEIFIKDLGPVRNLDVLFELFDFLRRGNPELTLFEIMTEAREKFKI